MLFIEKMIIIINNQIFYKILKILNNYLNYLQIKKILYLKIHIKYLTNKKNNH
jgi:hypothetical protein